MCMANGSVYEESRKKKREQRREESEEERCGWYINTRRSTN